MRNPLNHSGRSVQLLAVALLCAGTGFVLVRDCVCKHIDYYDYFDLPDAAGYSEFYHDNIEEALLKLDVSPSESPEEILSKVERAAKSEEKPARKDIYERLVSMASDEDVCPDPLLDQSKYIVALIKNNTVPAVNFRGFMHHFGRKKFDSCALRANRYFHLMLALGVEPGLDECMAKAMGVKGEPDDMELYEALRGFDLTKHKINVRAMAKAAANYEPKDEDSDNVMLKLILDFFDTKCGKLQTMLGSILDQLNLARLFGAEELAYRQKLLKMNEHQRLCLAIRRPASRAKIIHHLQTSIETQPEPSTAGWRRLAAKKSWFKKLPGLGK